MTVDLDILRGVDGDEQTVLDDLRQVVKDVKDTLDIISPFAIEPGFYSSVRAQRGAVCGHVVIVEE